MLFLRSMILALAVSAAPVLAQQAGPVLPRGTMVSAILTIDSERLFGDSAFGRRVAREVEENGAELAQENRRIEAELAAEEKDLTERRPVMTPEAFGPLADAFDEKVQQTRLTQTAKGRALNELLGKERDAFLTAAAPVLESLMREAGAAVILERRSVFVSANSIDITDEAIEQLDKTLGAGVQPKE